MATLVIMPRQGQSVESCVITEWKKKKGDTVAEGDVLFSYETDKSSLPIPTGNRINLPFCGISRNDLVKVVLYHILLQLNKQSTVTIHLNKFFYIQILINKFVITFVIIHYTLQSGIRIVALE